MLERVKITVIGDENDTSFTTTKGLLAAQGVEMEHWSEAYPADQVFPFIGSPKETAALRLKVMMLSK